MEISRSMSLVVLEHIKAGKVTPLGTTSAVRSDLVPDIPTPVEQGYPGAVAENWTALFAPAKTCRRSSPSLMRRSLPRERADHAPQVRRERHLGVAELVRRARQLLRSEIAKWDKLIREKES